MLLYANFASIPYTGGEGIGVPPTNRGPMKKVWETPGRGKVQVQPFICHRSLRFMLGR